MSYLMHYALQLTRTSMSLDPATLKTLAALSGRWSVSKAEVMRRAIRQLQEQADREDSRPTPLQAMEWLQNGGGITLQEAASHQAAIADERQAKRYWWE